MNRILPCCLAFIILALTLPGCGDKKPVGPDLSGAKITGKVVERGKQVKILPNETIRVAFIGLSDNESKITGSGDCKEDGSFEITGPSGKGLPAGKYKIALTSEIYGGGGDRFFEKLDAITSQIVIDLGTSGTDNFEVDIVTRKAVKK